MRSGLSCSRGRAWRRLRTWLQAGLALAGPGCSDSGDGRSLALPHPATVGRQSQLSSLRTVAKQMSAISSEPPVAERRSPVPIVDQSHRARLLRLAPAALQKAISPGPSTMSPIYSCVPGRSVFLCCLAISSVSKSPTPPRTLDLSPLDNSLWLDDTLRPDNNLWQL